MSNRADSFPGSALHRWLLFRQRTADRPHALARLRLDERLAPWALAVAGLLYVLFVSWLAIRRHERFHTAAFDLGIYVQALWQIAHGHDPYNTVRGIHILGDHFTPVLYPLALVYRLGWGTPGLLVAQAVALALGAWPLYRMGLRQLGSPWLALWVGVAYLLYPPVRSLGLCEFHPVALAVPGVLFALDAALARRALPMVAACAWTLACKQDAALVVVGIGIWYAWRWRQPLALSLAAGAMVYFAVVVRLAAHLAGTSENFYFELYADLGATPGEMLRTMLLHPSVPLKMVLTPRVFDFLLLLVWPLAFLPLRSPGLLWLMGLPLALNLLASRPIMQQIHNQYTALLIPVLLVAAVVSLGRVPAGRARRGVAVAWGVCAVAALLLVPLDWQRVALSDSPTAAEAAAIRQVLAEIPAGASVTASPPLVPHLAERQAIYVFPNPFVPLMTGPTRASVRQSVWDDYPRLEDREVQARLRNLDVEYVVIAVNSTSGLRVPRPEVPLSAPSLVAAALRSPAYGLVRDEAGIWILRRGADQAAGLRHLGLGPDDLPGRFEQVVAARMGVGIRAPLELRLAVRSF